MVESPLVKTKIAEMAPDDWESVRDIYEQGLATGNASFETDAPSWATWDERHHKHCRLVARTEGQLVAWAALAPVSQRACYAGVAEASLYVAADCRGRGIGRRLLLELIASSERHGIWSLVGSTFAENEPSLRLQLGCGFRIVGRRERIAQYRGVWRDTIFTERRSSIVGVE